MSRYDSPTAKDKIVSFIEKNGPSLPVHIAKDIGMSILFTSAFLSELFSEKRINMSNMRVGSSALYFVTGQEALLEPFASNLKSKEKEAHSLLKEKKFLKDSEQLPAIRVALREIKDFAIPFKNGEEIFWRYYLTPESEFVEKEAIPEIKKEVDKKPEEISLPVSEEKVREQEEKIRERPSKEIQKKGAKHEEKLESQKKEKGVKKKKSGEKEDKFLERVKEFLSKSSVEILGIEGLKKDELVLRIKEDGEESILFAYNKKKITEKEIISASKRASTFGLKYSVLSLSELPKKISDLIKALEGIKEIKKVG